MGLFDKLKNTKTDEDDVIALGVATGTTPEVWLDDDDGHDDDDGAAEADPGEETGEGDHQ